MTQWEQYEVWVQQGESWELAAAFRDFDVASAVAKARSRRVRLSRASYEGNTLVSSEVLAEVGAVREEP